MSTPDIDRLARETEEKVIALTGFGHALHANDALPDILSALRTAQSATANEDTARLNELCALLAGAWLYGGWKPETCAEGEMQTILRNRGWWPITEKQLVEKRAAIDLARREGK